MSTHMLIHWTCPKCSNTDQNSISMRYNGNPPDTLTLSCNRCGHGWWEMPADAELRKAVLRPPGYDVYWLGRVICRIHPTRLAEALGISWSVVIDHRGGEPIICVGSLEDAQKALAVAAAGEKRTETQPNIQYIERCGRCDCYEVQWRRLFGWFVAGAMVVGIVWWLASLAK